MLLLQLMVLSLQQHFKLFVSVAAHKAGSLAANRLLQSSSRKPDFMSDIYLFSQSAACLCQAVLSEDLRALVALEALQREEVERPAAAGGLLLLRRGPGNTHKHLCYQSSSRTCLTCWASVWKRLSK